MPVLSIFVPAAGKEHMNGIDARSAIVGVLQPNADRVTVYYEGNRYNASNGHRYDQKLELAAGRLVQRYPTIARSSLAVEALDVVGEYNTDTRSIRVLDAGKLNAWAGETVESGMTLEALRSAEYNRLMSMLRPGRGAGRV